jgi:hypothetical protein
MKVIKNFKTFCLSVGLIMISLSVGYGQKELTKIINYGISNDAYSVCQTKDSAYWVTGHSSSANETNTALTKLDFNGKEIFHKIFPTDGYGFYFYEITSEGKRLGTGKLLVF